MTLTPATRLGPYEIIAPLGAGGMGEVYRARDIKLNRDVAIKVLPDLFAGDAERLARFTREAQTLAALNHPNIAHIHGFEEAGSVRALVMELVEGEDLSQRIARGPLPADEALPIGRQIAEALEAAHEQGIIHRDLKPANIKVRADGVVKVLDFGLAKALEPGSGIGNEGSVNLANSPTITSPAMTLRGMILGTAAYMSPEQAKGKPVDKRTDIWAFGCVLYEMLAGRRAFDGEDISDTLAAILRGQPDWTTLPALPASVDMLVRRCLERDWRRRIGSMSTVRFVLEEPAVLSPAGAAAAQVAPGEMQARVDTAVAQARRHVVNRRVLPLAGLAAVAVAAAGVGFSRDGTPPAPPAPVARLLLGLPEGQVLGTSGRTMALSPSGTELAYLTEGRLLMRRLRDFEMVPVAATDMGQNLQSPAFSPDGSWIAFYAASQQSVKRISVQGGAALRVCDSQAVSLDWDASGILVARGSGGVIRCNPAGGPPEQLAKVEAGETVLAPQILPGGDALLFTIASLTGGPARWDQARAVVQSLRTGERKTVLEGGSGARYVSTGHLIYTVGGIVFAAPFDLDRRELRGEAVPVVEGVRRGTTGEMQLAVSDSGTLAYLPGPTGSQTVRRLAIGDRSGNITGLPVPPAAYSHVRVSPDGTRAALGVDDGKQASVLIYALSGTNAVQRLTSEGGNRFPVWSPDGRWIAFQSARGGEFAIFRQRADGTGVAERLTTAAAGEEHVPESWSPDGRYLSFGGPNSAAGTRVALWILTLADKTTAPFGDVASTGSTASLGSVFSPDGKWLAYAKATPGGVSDVSRGVFLQPFPATGAVYQVPKQLVDFHPVWTKSGEELVFTAAATAGQMVAVRVATAAGVTFGTPVRFPASVSGDRVASEPRAWDILPDGRFIGITSTTEDAGRRSSPEMRLVLNWFEELKQRVPVP
jgi:Tol biopolymer transport system component